MSVEKSNNKIIQFFDTLEDADQADWEYYASLSPDERVHIGLELLQKFYDTNPGFERIYRTVELGECPVSSDWRLGL